MGPSVVHRTDPYANNRAEVSHKPTRQRERQMRGFNSAGQLQRFASVHGAVQNLFRVGRHPLRAAHHRLLRTRAFGVWRSVVGRVLTIALGECGDQMVAPLVPVAMALAAAYLPALRGE